MIFCIIPSVFMGVLSNQFSRRWLTDFIIPIIFILKIMLCSIVLKKPNTKIVLNKFFINHSKFTFIFVLLGVLIYESIKLVFGLSTYSGLEPPVYSTFIFFLLKKKFLGVILIVFIVLISGKRAILLAISMLVFIFFMLNKLNLKFLKFALISFLIISFLGFYFVNEITEQPSFEKYLSTIETVSEGNEDELNTSSGGRIDEINTILEKMSIENYIFGKGIGFTYQLNNEVSNPEISNAHFSPIGIIGKYGIIFYVPFILFYFTMIKVGFKNRFNDGFSTQFCFFYIIAALFDSMFSYSIFINPLLPFCLGNLANNARFII